MAELAKKVMKKLTEEVERKGLKLSVTRPKREKQDDCVMRLFGGRAASVQQTWSDAGRLETLGVDLRTRVKKLGAKVKARREQCIVRFSLVKKNKAFQKNFMKMGVKKLLRAGMVPARTWRVHAVEIAEETDGSSSWKKAHRIPVLVHGNLWLRSGRGTLHFGYSEWGRGSLERKMAA